MVGDIPPREDVVITSANDSDGDENLVCPLYEAIHNNYIRSIYIIHTK